MKKNKKLIVIASLAVLIAVVSFLAYQNLSAGDHADNNDIQSEGGNMNKDEGWKEIEGAKYYFDQEGNRLTGEQVIEGKVYYFDESGKWDEADPLDAVVISVQRLDQQEVATSLTGGKTWIGDKIPEFYISMNSVTYPKDIEKLTVTYYNNSDFTLSTGSAFRLLMWNGNEWGPSPADVLVHPDEGYTIEPNGTLTLDCPFRNIELEAGRYLLVKEAWLQHEPSIKYNLSVEVYLID